MKDDIVNEMAQIVKINSGKVAFSRDETATLLRMSSVTVDRLAKRGLLKPNRSSRRPLYSAYEIARFLHNN